MSLLFFSRFPYYHIYQNIAQISLERLCYEIAHQVRHYKVTLLKTNIQKKSFFPPLFSLICLFLSFFFQNDVNVPEKLYHILNDPKVFFFFFFFFFFFLF